VKNAPQTAPLKNIVANIKLKWLIFTLLVFAILIKLALWQQHRAEEKQQRLSRIAQLKTQQAFSLTYLLTQLKNAGESIKKVNDLPVTLTAEFDQEKLFLLDNQVNGNRLGYRVYQLAYARAEQVYLLVNLGWVQGSINRQKLPDIEPIKGTHRFSGHVRIPEQGIILQEEQFSTLHWPLRVQQIALDKFTRLLNRPLQPFVIYVDIDDPIGFIKNWQPIVMPPEKHKAYAVQWLLLAIVWLVLMVSVVIKNSKNNDNKKMS
jgi:cytochrome oxidase assembly protein ShyY1